MARSAPGDRIGRTTRALVVALRPRAVGGVLRLGSPGDRVRTCGRSWPDHPGSRRAFCADFEWLREGFSLARAHCADATRANAEIVVSRHRMRRKV